MEPNPIQKAILSGVNPIVAFLSQNTCGEACWEAREDVCRCSCNGKNHGCLRRTDGKRPERTARIDGFRYILKAVGPNLYSEAKRINEAAPMRHIGTYAYHWSEADRGAPARLKIASRGQIDRWPELTAYRCEPWKVWKQKNPQGAPRDYPGFKKPYLLWIKAEVQQ